MFLDTESITNDVTRDSTLVDILKKLAEKMISHKSSFVIRAWKIIWKMR